MENTIVFVCGSTNGYGADQSMISILKYLKTKDVNLLVILPGYGRTCEMLEKEKIDYFCIPFKCWTNKNNNFIESYIKPIVKFFINIYLLQKNISKIKKNRNIVGVYSNSFSNYFSIMLAMKMKKPHIQHIREFGKDDFDWNYDFGIKNITKIANKYSKKIICISEAVKSSFENYFDKDKLVCVYNGISVNAINKKKKNEDVKRILMIGRLSDEKRQIVLLKAIKQLNERNTKLDYKVDIWGDGKNLEYLQKYIDNNKLNNIVNLKGYSNNINISEYDIGIICSKCEGFGRVTVEYMINGLPVIGTNTGATPEIIKDNETGLLFDLDDYNDLSEKIEDLLKDNEKRLAMGKKGKERAIQFFSEERMQKEIYSICVQIFNL